MRVINVRYMGAGDRTWAFGFECTIVSKHGCFDVLVQINPWHPGVVQVFDPPPRPLAHTLRIDMRDLAKALWSACAMTSAHNVDPHWVEDLTGQRQPWRFVVYKENG